jgi:hypothetical protein
MDWLACASAALALFAALVSFATLNTVPKPMTRRRPAFGEDRNPIHFYEQRGKRTSCPACGLSAAVTDPRLYSSDIDEDYPEHGAHLYQECDTDVDGCGARWATKPLDEAIK